jgi:HEAT repeat protein
MATNFQDTLAVLKNDEQPITAEAIYSLSDLHGENLQSLTAAWGAIPVERRQTLIQRLIDTAETNFDMDFNAVARLALTDLDDTVRAAAVEAALIDESPDMLRYLMGLASGDISDEVRAAAVSALGSYILQGELGKLDPELARRAENIALKLYNDPNERIDVRRRALEAIANCSREGVDEMISASYKDDNSRMRASAVFAMGRSCDTRWSSVVLRELDSADPEMRYEAARTAGELELQEALPHLARLLDDDDREIMEMAVWSLGEIGGQRAQRLLEDIIERADETGDDSLLEAAEEALGAASLAGGDLVF